MKKAEMDALIFENVYDDGTCLWFTEFDYNGLFKLEKGNSEAEWMGTFPNENFMQERLYSSMALCQNKLYFAPHSAKEIAVYNMESNLFKKMNLIRPNIDNGFSWEQSKFYKIAAIDESIYLIPFHYPGILCYNTKTEEFFCFDDWIGEIEKIRESKWGYFISCQQAGKQLILPCACADAVAIFDTITKKTKIIHMPHTSYPCKYCGVCYAGGYYYFIAGDGTVVKSKLEQMQEKSNKINQIKPGTDEISYYPIQYMNGFIYLFPFRNGMGWKIDIKTDEIIPECLFDDEKEYCGKNFCFLTAISDKGKLYSVTGNSRRFIQYDFQNNSKLETQIIPSEHVRKLVQYEKKQAFVKKFYQECIMEETEGLLPFMIDAIVTIDKKKEDKNAGNGKIGSEIYHKLMSNVTSGKDAD